MFSALKRALSTLGGELGPSQGFSLSKLGVPQAPQPSPARTLSSLWESEGCETCREFPEDVVSV